MKTIYLKLYEFFVKFQEEKSTGDKRCETFF